MSRIKIAILTSSRADYGIYLTLINALKNDGEVDLHLIVFGMHLMDAHSATLETIEVDHKEHVHKVGNFPAGDDAASITKYYGELIADFSTFWNSNSFNYVVALGDRYEMSAAVQSTIPYGIKVAHLHGGETTLGAIDNIYRHQISLASTLHFVAAEDFALRLRSLLETDKNIFNVGSLSIDGLEDMKLPDWKKVKEIFSIPSGAFILITFHPETASNTNVNEHVDEVKRALEYLSREFILVITATNADTSGTKFSNLWRDLKQNHSEKIVLIESFGKANYFSALHNCQIVLGNSSSGIIEAASFSKYVVNVGDRQKGRLQSGNVINVPFKSESIIEGVNNACSLGSFTKPNAYYKSGTVNQILKTLKSQPIL